MRFRRDLGEIKAALRAIMPCIRWAFLPFRYKLTETGCRTGLIVERVDFCFCQSPLKSTFSQTPGGVLLQGTQHFRLSHPMASAIRPNYILAPPGDPHFLFLSFLEKLSSLVSLSCHPLKTSFQRIAGVCLGRNDTTAFEDAASFDRRRGQTRSHFALFRERQSRKACLQIPR